MPSGGPLAALSWLGSPVRVGILGVAVLGLVTLFAALALLRDRGDSRPDVGIPDASQHTAQSSAPSASPGTPITAPFDLPILMYHHIGQEAVADAYPRLTVSNDEFDAQLAYLQCAGYTTLSVAELFEAIEGQGSLPPKPIILTFDDGYRSQYDNALPLLQKHGFTGSLAVVTGFLSGGGAQYMNWQQLQEMSVAGMEILSHTVTHRDLGTISEADLQNELTASRSELESRTGRRVQFLVYPAGEPFRSGTAEAQERVLRAVQDAGYRGALLDSASSTVQDPSTPYQLNRVRVDGGESVDAFVQSIATANSPADNACRQASG